MSYQSHKLNVMHIILNLEIGGAQEVVRTLVQYLASDNCTPIVCSFKDGPLRQTIEQLGIKVEILPERRYSVISFPQFILEIIQIWRLLANLIKKYDITIVQTHLLKSLDFLVLALRYNSSLQVVLWTFHSANFVLRDVHLPKNKWMLKPKKFFYRLLYRFAAHLTDGFIAVSNEVKEAIIRVNGPIQDRVFVICNGVDVNRYGRPVNKAEIRGQLSLKDDAYVIAMVGTLRPVKGHQFMLQAMASITPKHPEIQVLVIGDGELREELQKQAHQLSLSNHIHFLGNRSDVPNLLAVSNLFIMPSLWEGLPMALLEAMATGLPIIASEVSGTVQVMIPNETGLLIPPGDAAALATAIETLLSNPEQARLMGIAARNRVETEFSARKQAHEHLALYYRFLNRPLQPESRRYIGVTGE